MVCKPHFFMIQSNQPKMQGQTTCIPTIEAILCEALARQKCMLMQVPCGIGHAKS
jgi:hypothetical protein